MLLETAAQWYDNSRTHQVDARFVQTKIQLQIEGNLFVFLVVV